MSVRLAPQSVLERIALEYTPTGRYADRHLPQCSKVAAIVAADPTSALNKKIKLVVRNGGASATKMLRLYKVATDSGLEASDLKKLLKDEAKRLVDRALDLTARHGAKARIRLATLRALFVAGFIKESVIKAIETNMLTQKQVRELVATYNGVDATRWEQLKKAYGAFLQEPTPVVKTRKSIKRTSHQVRRREAGVVVQKPLTKAAFLLSGNGGEKHWRKVERQEAARKRRAKYRANGKTRSSRAAAINGGSGESAKQTTKGNC